MIKYLQLFCLSALLWVHPVYAQERTVPGSEAQIHLSFAPVVKKVSPAVVNIYTKRVVAHSYNPFASDPFFGRMFQGNMFGGRMKKQVESSLGSGVIVKSDGLIVTNAHVVKDAQEITVALSDGREFPANLALVEEASDLALLRIEDEAEDLPYVSLRPSESLEVGDLVLAIGNPFGVGQTVTSGIVSAQGRSTLDINDFNFFIQTDAAINPGNSGGPLVTLDGGVVGINSAIYSRDGGSLGIGFAIPSEMVQSVIAAEKAGKTGSKGIVRPWLGVSAQSVTSDIAQGLGLERPGGALIASLHQASPLKTAGLAVGDIVKSLGGRDIKDPSEMKFRMATVPLGEEAEIGVIRKGKPLSFKVKAIAPPDIPARDATAVTGNNPLSGAVIANINPALALELGLEAEDGVVIADIKEGSMASRLFRQGDLIAGINQSKTGSVADIRQVMAETEKTPQSSWSVTFVRNGRTQQIVIR
ncbi:MAG: Do family serine endopeptidase [Alphaproteobacteria bacterium]|nr:Do family serine endopeptidase [Alphaproteobacteria bacterium]MCD8570439.1 Do family serine endopeptidase [Alphaproteobacteria bacterium]